MGKISTDNIRTLITIPKEMKAELARIAKSENRSFSNLVLTILAEYLRHRQ